jgi:tyrosine-specific transport protein
MMSKLNRFVGAVLLVSGTTIGAGMLALPASSGFSGFLPSLILMTAIWLFMMATAFYLLEVNLRFPGESNIISMIHKTLGKGSEAFAWILYLLLLYALLSAYIVGCGQLLSEFTAVIFKNSLPLWLLSVGISVFFGFFVFFGTVLIDWLNRFLMTGLIGAYLILILLGFFFIDPSLLAYQGWTHIAASSSVIVTSFGYHIIIPTLTAYLDHDVKLLKRAIFIGSLIPYLIYVFWQILTLGIIPVYGDLSLQTAVENGVQITFFLKKMIGNPWVGWASSFFAFFAIVTSILGVSLSLSDFIADGLKIKKNYRGKLLLILLTFAPPLLFALFYPQGFILALRYAGIIVILLLAFLPALMAWFERFRAESSQGLLTPQFKVPGGKSGILATLVISLLLLGLEVFR